jgi:hypothetical protein
MIDRQLKLRVVPWDDQAFRRMVDEVVLRVMASRPELPPILAADLVQHELRLLGCDTAVVLCQRTPDDVRAGRATWTALRDGLIDADRIPGGAGTPAHDLAPRP